MKRSVNNRNIILNLFQEHGPCTIKELLPKAKAAGVTLSDDSFSPCIGGWYNVAKDGWQYLHRIKIEGTKEYLYEFDGATERAAKPRINSVKKPAKKPPSKSLARIDSKATQSPAKRLPAAVPTEVFAKILHDEPDFVVALTQDRRILVGGYYEPKKP